MEYKDYTTEEPDNQEELDDQDEFNVDMYYPDWQVLANGKKDVYDAPQKEALKQKIYFAAKIVAAIAVLLLGKQLLFNSSNDEETASSTEQLVNDESNGNKILVEDDSYKTVVTAKSINLDNIKIYKTAGGDKKAGKVQEGVPCALLKEKEVDGEKWALIDFCNQQGWCRMDMLRKVSGDIKYFYVEKDSTNMVFINENEIKLHTDAGKKTDISFTNVKYGTELNILEVKDGWGKTMYKNQECWVDMNVVGFYASKYWQIERCDGSTSGIKIRKNADENSDVLGMVPLTTVLKSDGFKNGWSKFSYNGKVGWVKLHYATPCGGDKGLSFTEDKTEATTQTKKATEKKEEKYILRDSSSRYLTEGDIAGLTDKELGLAINEIYARHGRIFDDKYYREYFESCSWYKGSVKADDFDESVFNEYEKANIDLLAAYRNKDSKNDKEDKHVIADSSDCYLTEDDIEGLTDDELGLAINEIYARHGRIFDNEYYRKYFESCSWYEGSIKADDFDESVFNEYEKANIAFLSSYRK